MKMLNDLYSVCFCHDLLTAGPNISSGYNTPHSGYNYHQSGYSSSPSGYYNQSGYGDRPSPGPAQYQKDNMSSSYEPKMQGMHCPSRAFVVSHLLIFLCVIFCRIEI